MDVKHFKPKSTVLFCKVWLIYGPSSSNQPSILTRTLTLTKHFQFPSSRVPYLYTSVIIFLASLAVAKYTTKTKKISCP